MKQTKTGGSLRASAKWILVAGTSVLLAAACGGGDDEGGDGDGDGDSSTGGTGTGGVGTGGVGTGGVGTGGVGTGGAPSAGTAVNTPITAGNFAVDSAGFGTDSVAGFQGFAYTYADMGGTTIFPDGYGAISATEVTEGKLCAYGVAAQVVDDDGDGTPEYSKYYGAGIGWNLDQDVEGTPEEAISINGIDAVSFTLVSETSATLRFLVNDTDGQGYCTTIAPGANTITLTDLNTECWADPPTGTAFDPATVAIKSVNWQIVSNTAAPSPFDVCVGGLSFSGTPIGGGGAGGASN